MNALFTYVEEAIALQVVWSEICLASVDLFCIKTKQIIYYHYIKFLFQTDYLKKLSFVRCNRISLVDAAIQISLYRNIAGLGKKVILYSKKKKEKNKKKIWYLTIYSKKRKLI